MLLKNSNFSLSSFIIFKWIYLWLVFSSFIIALIYWILPIPINIIPLKDLGYFILVIYALFVLGLKKDISVLILFLPALLYLGICFIYSDSILFARAASLRQMLTPYFIVISCYIVLKKDDDLYPFIIKVLWVVVCFGFFEIIFKVWKVIDIRPFFTIKNIAVGGDGYPFVLTEPILNVKRMSSTFLDPINLGHTLVCFFFIYKINNHNKLKKYLYCGFILLALFFTFSKGAWLQLVLIFTFFNHKIPVFFKIIGIGVGILLYSILMNYHQGLVIHLFGFTSVFSSLNTFGYGIGMVGNQSFMAYGSVDVLNLGIADTFVGALLGQLGWFGALLWFSPFLFIVYFLGIRNIYVKILLSQLLVSILSENTINLLSMLTISVLIGNELMSSHKFLAFKKQIKEYA